VDQWAPSGPIVIERQAGAPNQPEGIERRSVPMSKRVARELDLWHQTTKHKAEGALVFAQPVSGEVLRRRALMRRYKPPLKAAQLDESHRFHDPRHTFGTRMASTGMDMRRLQVLMGHRDLKTTLIYADYVPSAEEVAMADEAFADELREPRGSNRVPI
jgi:site-specific recombinase XerD